MSKFVLLDEIHISVRVPASLAEREIAGIRRSVMARAFLTRLRQTVRRFLAAELPGWELQVRVSR